MKKIFFLCLITLPIQVWAASQIDTLNIFFDSGSNALSYFQADLIDQFLENLKSKDQIVVAGHADASGNPIENIEQSKQRAKEVAAYLMDRNVPQNSLLLQAYGAVQPLASNQSAYGRARNRRVELIVHHNADQLPMDPTVPVDTVVVKDGYALPFQQMTSDGERLRRICVIRLVKDYINLMPGSFANYFNPVGNRILTEPTPMLLRLPIRDSLVCYSGSINFVDSDLNSLMDQSMRGDQLLFAEKDTAGYFFSISLLDSLDTDQSFMLGKDCHVIHSALLKTEDKLNFRAFSASSVSRQLPKAYQKLDEQTYRVYWLDNRMQDTRLNLSVKRKRRARQTKSPITLKSLNYNAASNTFTLDKKTYKSLSKAQKQKN